VPRPAQPERDGEHGGGSAVLGRRDEIHTATYSGKPARLLSTINWTLHLLIPLAGIRLYGRCAGHAAERVVRFREMGPDKHQWTGGTMFSLHLPPRLAPLRKAFTGVDPSALLVIAFAIVSGSAIVATFLFL
jgi:hypothetical protein